MGGPRSVRSPSPQTAWGRVALMVLGLMVLPLGLWLLLPSPPDPVVAAVTSAAPPPEVSGDAPAAPLVTRTISGVVNSDAGEPIAGASVRLHAAGGGGVLGSATTDAEGQFTLARAPMGEVDVHVTKEGFSTADEPVDAATEPTPVELTITLTEAQWVTGIVAAPNQRPVADATVGCDDRDDPLMVATTDGSGRFKLPPEADGCAGFAEHPSWGPSEIVTFSVGANNRLVLTGPGSISGVVVDESGRPLDNYLIGVESFEPAVKRDIPHLKKGAKTIEEPNGAFELTALAAGTYVLTASAEGRPPTSSDPIELAPGEDVRNVRISLAKGGTLSGSVVDAASGDPVVGASVSLDRATMTGANAIGPVTTDDEGAFELEGVPNKRYSIKVSHGEYRTRIVTGLQGTQSQDGIQLEPRTEGGGQSEFGGIGAVLMPAGNAVKVAGVLAEGPAKDAGLTVGDLIRRVDGEDVSEATFSDVMQMLRGPDGTRVTITIERDGETIETTMTRSKIVR